MSGPERQFCDKCNGKIVNGICPCGLWFDLKHAERMLVDSFMDAIETFGNLNTPLLSGDSHNGCAFVYWRGGYDDVKKVRRFIQEEILDERT